MCKPSKSLGIDQLSVAQRILLVERSGQHRHEAAPLSEAKKRTCSADLTRMLMNPKAGSSWEDVKVRLRGSRERALSITPDAEMDLGEARSGMTARRVGPGFPAVCGGSSRPCPITSGGIQGSSAGARRVIVRRFPYGLYYRVDSDQIAVIAFYHTKRDRGLLEGTRV